VSSIPLSLLSFQNAMQGSRFGAEKGHLGAPIYSRSLLLVPPWRVIGRLRWLRPHARPKRRAWLALGTGPELCPANAKPSFNRNETGPATLELKERNREI
jgi:hypothetical protein